MMRSVSASINESWTDRSLTDESQRVAGSFNSTVFQMLDSKPIYGTILIYCNHVAILLVGIFLFVLFATPNVMISDSGTPLAHGLFCIGMIAQVLFAGGGCVGLVTGSWLALLPGVAVQVIFFGIIIILGYIDSLRKRLVGADIAANTTAPKQYSSMKDSPEGTCA